MGFSAGQQPGEHPPVGVQQLAFAPPDLVRPGVGKPAGCYVCGTKRTTHAHRREPSSLSDETSGRAGVPTPEKLTALAKKDQRLDLRTGEPRTVPPGSPAASVTFHMPTRSDGRPPGPEGDADGGLGLGLAGALRGLDGEQAASSASATIAAIPVLATRTRIRMHVRRRAPAKSCSSRWTLCDAGSACQGRGMDDATALAGQIRCGEVSAREAVEKAIANIERLNPELNAVVNTRFDEALAEVDQGLPDGPFTGVPFLVKDLGVEVAGLPATRGSRLFADAIAPADSPLVARYRKAGLVVLGTTNTPEFGKNASTEPLLHGPTRNPWRTTHSPGGSSGGSAAAVASGMVAVAHASDGGGSIRIPASMCGLFGFKPSRGRVPGSDIGDGFAYPLAVPHVLTTSVRDSAALLYAVCAPMAGQPFSAPPASNSYAAEARTSPGSLRIALCTTNPSGHPTAAACAAAAESAAKLCESLGHHVSEAAPTFDAAAASAASATVMSGVSLANIRRRLAELGRDLADDDLEPFTRFLYDRSIAMTAEQFIEALRGVDLTGRAIAPFFEQYDVLITPTIAATVPPLGWLDTSRPQSMFENAAQFASYTSPYNVTGQPAMSMPLAHDETGLPVGVQFVAAVGREGTLFRLAGQIEQAAPWQQVSASTS